LLGIVFDTQVGVVLSVIVWMLHSLIMLGIVFDTRDDKDVRFESAGYRK
jgi:hypothetical protein